MDIHSPLFIAGSVQTEALMVGLVNAVFLTLFIVAGIRQKLKDKE